MPTIAELISRAEAFFVSSEDGEDRESMAAFWTGVAHAAVAGPTALARLLDAYDGLRAAEQAYADAFSAAGSDAEHPTVLAAEQAVEDAIEALAECAADAPESYQA